MVSSHVAASITLPPTFTEGHIDFEVTGLNPAQRSYTHVYLHVILPITCTLFLSNKSDF